MSSSIALPYVWRFPPAILFIISFAALCLVYVWQITALSMRQYVKNDLVRERAALSETADRWQREALEQQSLARLNERLKELQLIRDTNVVYVTREDLRMSLSQR